MSSMAGGGVGVRVGYDLLCNQIHGVCTKKHWTAAWTAQGQDDLATNYFSPQEWRLHNPEGEPARPGEEALLGYLVLIFEHSRRGPRVWGHRVCRLEVGGKHRLWAPPARARLGASRQRQRRLQTPARAIVAPLGAPRQAMEQSEGSAGRGVIVRNLRDRPPPLPSTQPTAPAGTAQPASGLNSRAHWLPGGACALSLSDALPLARLKRCPGNWGALPPVASRNPLAKKAKGYPRALTQIMSSHWL